MKSEMNGLTFFVSILMTIAVLGAMALFLPPVQTESKAAVQVVNLTGQESAKVKCDGDEVIYTAVGPNEGVLTCRVWVGVEK